MSEFIGIIGGGVMGRGVAQRFAKFGYNTIIIDKSDEMLEIIRNDIIKQLKIARFFDKSLCIDEIIERISFSSDYSKLKDVDYVIENVNENEEVKKQVYLELDKYCKEDCIYMVNTSCIPITLIGSFTKRAEKVIGVHFMNPVPLKNFSEVIKGFYTSDETIEKIRDLLLKAGISIEIINDGAGFVSNRISHLYMNEAAFIVYEGIATAQQVDAIFEKGFGHTMGPLHTADLIGLDTVLDSLKVLYDEYQDPKFKACPLLKEFVRCGKLGRKTGHGFFDYV